MSKPETDLNKIGETVFTEAAIGTATPSIPAVDGRKIVGRVKSDTVAPGVSDDDTQGFAPGLRWVNTTVPVKSYVCIDASTGAAIWIREGNLKINFSATVDPTVSDDGTQGYEVGSHWFNITDQRVFQALDVSTGAAIWAEYLQIGGRPGGQNIIGGTGASEELTFRGSSNADLGLIRAKSPIVFDDILPANALSAFYVSAKPSFTTTVGAVMGGFELSPTITFNDSFFIWTGITASPIITSGVGPVFAAFILMFTACQVTSAVSGRNPLNATVFNLAATTIYSGNSGSVTSITTGMFWAPQLRCTGTGGTNNWSSATAVIVSPKFSTLSGTTAAMGTIRGVWGQNPGPGFLQPGAGSESMTSYILVDQDNVTFGGNVTKAAVRSAQAAATNAFFLLQTSNAQSRFVGEVQHRSNTVGIKLGTGDTVGLRYDGANFVWDWAGGDSLQWLNITAFNYWRLNASADQGLQFDLTKISFGDIAPLLTRNWFTAFFPRARTTNFAGEWTDMVFQATAPVTLAHNMTIVSAFVFRESQIIRGGFDLPVAATVWVDTVPTEGDKNYGIYAPTGRHLLNGHRRRSAAYAGYA